MERNPELTNLKIKLKNLKASYSNPKGNVQIQKGILERTKKKSHG